MKIVSITAVVCLSLVSADAESTRWSSFQNGGQIEVNVESAPWLKGLVTVWESPVEGHGQSSPVVWDDLAYVTTTIGDMKEAYRVVALRIDSGEIVWSRDLKNPTPRKNNVYVSRAAPTPAVDEEGVIAFFEGGIAAAWTHTGELRWERNIVEEFGAVTTQFGVSASVEQSSQHAYFWVERSENPYVLAVNKSDGSTAWKVDGLGATSWSTPRLVAVGDGLAHIVLSADGSLVGLDPNSGDRLWTLDGLAGNTSPTPVPLGGGRFLIGASAGRASEVAANVFDSNGMVQISQGDSGWSAEFVWTGEKTAVSFSSPVAHNGVAYFVNRSGVLTAVDATNGKKMYAKRLAGTLWATPIVLGDIVLFPLKEGQFQCVAAGPEFREVATHQLVPESEDSSGGPFGGAILYGVAFASDRVICRTGDRVYCVTPAYE